jgi:glycosyltransferase involved in cell wall biosynthesis
VRPVYFNGKFYAGGLNGVHRVADRLIREYDAILSAMPADARPAATLFIPKQRQWGPELTTIRIVEEEGAHTQRWEQWRLPRLSRDGVLVNLCNLAPLRHPNQLLLIHDAQFLFPDSGYPLKQRLGYRWLVPRMARASATVLTVSEYSRAMLDVLGVVPRERTQVLYNGADHILEQAADPQALARLGLTHGGYVLLFGSTKAYKNVRVVFDAMREPIPGLRLVVIGTDAAAFARAGLEPPADTVFAGKVDDAVLRALYEGAHCLAFPSRTEGFGLPPVEAMLCGCPVVAAPAGAIPEVCRDAVAYADVDDAAGWREAIAGVREVSSCSMKLAVSNKRGADFSWNMAGIKLHAAVADMSRRRDTHDG